MPDSRVVKWQRWLHESIRPHIYTIHLHRYIYQELIKITQGRDLPPSYFFDFGSQTYATSQAVAIRRLADPNPRAISLGRLLNEIASDAQRLNRDFYVGLYATDIRPMGERAFTSKFADATGDHVDPKIVNTDLEALRTGAERVSRYVDQYVAHLDEKPRAAIPTFDDLNKAVDLVGDLYQKYNNLVTASDYVTLVPEIQHDWKAVFRVPWIELPQRRPR
jgi:hypothetical protein